MTTETADETRTPMSWEEYEALGEVPTRRHQEIVFDLGIILRGSLAPSTTMTMGWGWSPEGVREELVPDLMVHRSEENLRLTASAPLLVVEVLSSNRRTDLIEKPFRYARWGAPAYWVVDPRDHELMTYRLDDEMFRRSSLDADGVVTVSYGETEVEIDLDALLG